jgi:hypothetical protein
MHVLLHINDAPRIGTEMKRGVARRAGAVGDCAA